MKKQFVPYELALRLREKGFNERCVASWLSKKFSFDGKEVLHIDERYGNGQDQIYMQIPIKCLAPLWQQVIDWFRDKHDIHIHPNYRENIFGAQMFYEYLVHHKVDGDWKLISIVGENPREIAIYEALKKI